MRTEEGKAPPLTGDKAAMREISLWSREMSSVVVFAPHKVAVTSAWDLDLICVLASASDSSAGKESTGNAGELGSPGEGKGSPLLYSGLENPMDYIYSAWGCKASDTTEQLSLLSLGG